jgi:hypothetical protein
MYLGLTFVIAADTSAGARPAAALNMGERCGGNRASEELHEGLLTGGAVRQVQLTEETSAVDDVAGVWQRLRENLNVVAGLDLAERLVRGMTSLLGICGEESQQRVVCALEKGGEGVSIFLSSQNI